MFYFNKMRYKHELNIQYNINKSIQIVTFENNKG